MNPLDLLDIAQQMARIVSQLSVVPSATMIFEGALHQAWWTDASEFWSPQSLASSSTVRWACSATDWRMLTSWSRVLCGASLWQQIIFAFCLNRQLSCRMRHRYLLHVLNLIDVAAVRFDLSPTPPPMRNLVWKNADGQSRRDWDPWRPYTPRFSCCHDAGLYVVT